VELRFAAERLARCQVFPQWQGYDSFGCQNPDDGQEEPAADPLRALARLVQFRWSGSGALSGTDALLFFPANTPERKVRRAAAKAVVTPYATRVPEIREH
jgi:hypothetical protein